LADGQITIVSKNAPDYVPGKSPLFEPGPYVRFSGRTHGAADLIENIALDRPTHASSEAAGHQARLASDGDAKTFWAAATADVPAWWDCDLEGVYDLTAVRLRFPVDGHYAYDIQTSADRTAWKSLLTGEATSTAGGAVRVNLPAGTRASGLRIVLMAVPEGATAGLSEIAITGSRAPQQ
jgi:hypothetical protein